MDHKLMDHKEYIAGIREWQYLSLVPLIAIGLALAAIHHQRELLEIGMKAQIVRLMAWFANDLGVPPTDTSHPAPMGLEALATRSDTLGGATIHPTGDSLEKMTFRVFTGSVNARDTVPEYHPISLCMFGILQYHTDKGPTGLRIFDFGYEINERPQCRKIRPLLQGFASIQKATETEWLSATLYVPEKILDWANTTQARLQKNCPESQSSNLSSDWVSWQATFEDNLQLKSTKESGNEPLAAGSSAEPRRNPAYERWRTRYREFVDQTRSGRWVWLRSCEVQTLYQQLSALAYEYDLLDLPYFLSPPRDSAVVEKEQRPLPDTEPARAIVEALRHEMISQAQLSDMEKRQNILQVGRKVPLMVREMPLLDQYVAWVALFSMGLMQIKIFSLASSLTKVSLPSHTGLWFFLDIDRPMIGLGRFGSILDALHHFAAVMYGGFNILVTVGIGMFVLMIKWENWCRYKITDDPDISFPAWLWQGIGDPFWSTWAFWCLVLQIAVFVVTLGYAVGTTKRLFDLRQGLSNVD
jgi:hypothetical protein